MVWIEHSEVLHGYQVHCGQETAIQHRSRWKRVAGGGNVGGFTWNRVSRGKCHKGFSGNRSNKNHCGRQLTKDMKYMELQGVKNGNDGQS